MQLKFPEEQIPALAARYSYSRDEQVLVDLRDKVRAVGYLERSEIKLVALWKAPRIAGHVDKNDPEFVREVTRWALSASTERGRIEPLTLISGVQWPMASVILHLFHSDFYPILDFRALWSVGLEVPDQYSFEFWWSYVEFCRATATRTHTDMRTLDRALWQFSKEQSRDAPEYGNKEGTGTAADRIRSFVYETIVEPKLREGVAEISVRAGDVHSAMHLQSRMPDVCSAVESRKFAEAHGLELVRREGPHRGANVVYYFQPRGPLAARTSRKPKSERSPEPPQKVTRHPTQARAGTVYWVSCVSQKRSAAAPAKDLYVSDLFLKGRAYVEAKGAPWFVLSAKYGLVPADQVIEPYELTLNTLPVEERRRWANKVLDQLAAQSTLPSKVVMLAGARYREFLESQLRARGVEVEVPMEGLRIGEQLSWLGSQPQNTRLKDLRRFYDLLARLQHRLGGKRTLADCHGHMDWPARGVYFFFEPGETRFDSGTGQRLVRVGTHALIASSKTTLWERLKQHRGFDRGGGNHRGSIFRLVLGAALKQKQKLAGPSSWGVKDVDALATRLSAVRAKLIEDEQGLERAVSEYVQTMPFVWLAIDDEPGATSLRGVIERNSIALLSNFDRDALDAPSGEWLGHSSDRRRVRRSGLWNSNHVEENYAPEFYVSEQLIQ